MIDSNNSVKKLVVQRTGTGHFVGFCPICGTGIALSPMQFAGQTPTICPNLDFTEMVNWKTFTNDA